MLNIQETFVHSLLSGAGPLLISGEVNETQMDCRHFYIFFIPLIIYPMHWFGVNFHIHMKVSCLDSYAARPPGLRIDN